MALSSETLESQFGPTELEILRQDVQERIICTKTANNGQILELSRVIFRPKGVAAFPEIHQKILSGNSIGKAFKEAGVSFMRDVRVSYRYDDIPASFIERFDMQGSPTVTDVLVMAGPDRTPYADILEVYSPAVMPWESSSRQINPGVVTRINDFGAMLADIA